MGEQFQIAILVLLVIILLFVTYVCAVLLSKQSPKKPTGKVFKVKIGFANSKMKLTLNPEQYEHLEAILNQKEGYFQIGDEMDIVRIYRESICWVKVKRK